MKCHQTGFGFDSHLFSRSGVLVLGGIRFPGVPTLKGHSDGDAVLHAVIDALLGAVSKGDIGELFPDTSCEFKGASSLLMLRNVAALVRSSKFVPIHIDVTVLADRPKLAAAKRKMAAVIARECQLPARAVNVKAKTQEGMKLFKSPGGIAVWAVATVRPK